MGGAALIAPVHIVFVWVSVGGAVVVHESIW